MESNIIPQLQVEETLVVPSGTSTDHVSSPKDGLVLANTDLGTLEVSINGVYQKLNGLPIGTEQTVSGTVPAGFMYPVNTTSGTVTLTVVAGADNNSRIGFFDVAGTWGTNSFIFSGGDELVNGTNDTVTFALNNASASYVKTTGDRGWRPLTGTTDTANVRGLSGVSFLTGSVTASVAKAYLLNYHQTITITNGDDSDYDGDYTLTVGTVTYNSTDSLGPFYYVNASDSTKIIAKFLENQWVMLDTDTGTPWYTQKERVDYSTPLSIQDWVSSSETAYDNIIDLANVAISTTTNSYTITLPSTAIDRDAIFIGDIYGCASGINLTIGNTSQSFTLDQDFQWMLLQYYESTGKWLLTQGGLSQTRNQNRPQQINANTVNASTHLGHTHNIAKPTDTELESMTSDGFPTLSMVNESLGYLGLGNDLSGDTSTEVARMRFPESSLNSVAVRNGDYLVDDQVSDGPSDSVSGIVAHRQINDSQAIQLFHQLSDNSLYSRIYPDTTTWTQIIDGTWMDGKGMADSPIGLDSSDDLDTILDWGFYNGYDVTNGPTALTTYDYLILPNFGTRVTQLAFYSYNEGGTGCYYRCFNQGDTGVAWTRFIDSQMIATTANVTTGTDTVKYVNSAVLNAYLAQYGLNGISAGYSGDLDDLTTGGEYFISGGNDNAPLSNAGFVTVRRASTGTSIIQTYQDNTVGYKFSRTYYNSSWRDWIQEPQYIRGSPGTNDSVPSVWTAYQGHSMNAFKVYSQDYPTAYGNIISVLGSGFTQILQSWPGSDGGGSAMWIRAKRDTGSDIWGDWARVITESLAATDAQALAGTDELRYITPEALAYVLGNSTSAGVPVGVIAPFVASEPPTGWLELDGSAISRTTYADLWSYASDQGVLVAESTKTSLTAVLDADADNPIQTYAGSFGTGDGSSTFTLPDFRGIFLRGYDSAGTIDPDGASRSIGELQADAFKSHHHTVPHSTNSGSTNNSRFSSYDTNTTATDISTSSTGDDETRPINNAVLYCIKY